MDALTAAARGTDNLVPPIIQAVESHATLGEVVRRAAIGLRRAPGGRWLTARTEDRDRDRYRGRPRRSAPRIPNPDLGSLRSHLTTVFDLPSGVAPAVIDVSFHLDKGETLCLVGESGSGKSVTALSMLRLVDRPGRIAGGSRALRWARSDGPRRACDACGSRGGHLPDLPGADDRPEPGLHDRQPDRGDAAGARRGARPGGAAARD